MKNPIWSDASCVVRKAVSRLHIPAAKEMRNAGVGFASEFGVIGFQRLTNTRDTYQEIVTLNRR